MVIKQDGRHITAATNLQLGHDVGNGVAAGGLEDGPLELGGLGEGAAAEAADAGDKAARKSMSTDAGDEPRADPLQAGRAPRR